MDRILCRSFRLGLALALVGLFSLQAVSAEDKVKRTTRPAVGTPTSKEPALKTGPGKGVPQALTSDVQVLSIDSVQVIPPQAGSNVLKWVCRVKNNSKMVFQAPSVYVDGLQKNSQGQWIMTGRCMVDRIDPLATREFVQQFSISGNSTVFKIRLGQAPNTTIKESQEIALPAVQMPQVKIQSAVRVGNGWDITVKNEQSSGYSPMGMILQVLAAKANSPTTWTSSGSWTVPALAAQATHTQHFGIHLDSSYTIYRVRLVYDTNTLDEKSLNL
ncbi:MAG: hypothetical protein ACE144_09085 [Thermodesulfobacteriota bacterium]